LYQGKSQCLQNSIFASAEVSASGEQIQLKDAFDEVKDIIEDQTVIKIDTEGCELAILNSKKLFLISYRSSTLNFIRKKIVLGSIISLTKLMGFGMLM
jgi:hypothetical protein